MIRKYSKYEQVNLIFDNFLKEVLKSNEFTKLVISQKGNILRDHSKLFSQH